jgi:Protein of unknown function (DUF2971)
MDDLINNFFDTPIPEKVWHYTTLAGFEGILSSGTVWATEVHNTTDPTEFIHARAVVTAYLKRVEPSDKSAAYAKQAALNVLVNAFDDGALSQAKMEIFVASFSSVKNLKSQWMGYASGGSGVSIAFDLRQIRPPQEIGSTVTFAPCVYVQEEKEKLVEAALDHFIETSAKLHRDTGSRVWAGARLRDWSLVDEIYGLEFDRSALDLQNNEYFHQQLHSALAHTSFDLLRAANHCKEYSFHPEHEWRLSLPHTKGKQFTGIEIQYRGLQHDIPYLAHNLFSEKLPITQILAGPLCQNMAQIHELLNKYGYQVPVIKSDIHI